MIETLKKHIQNLKKIDSHEHLPKLSDLSKQKIDLIDLFTPYMCDMIVSSGCTEAQWLEISGKNIEFSKRYQMLLKYLPAVKNCTYYKAVEFGVKQSLGYDLNEYDKINEALSTIDEQFYINLFEKNNIKTVASFLDYKNIEYMQDSSLIAVPTVTYAIPYTKEILHELSSVCNIKIDCCDDLRLAYKSLFESYKKIGLSNIKIGSAYWTKFDINEKPCDKTINECLKKIANGSPSKKIQMSNVMKNVRYPEFVELECFCFNTFIELASELNFNVIIHTGFHAWGNNDPNACHSDFLYKAAIKFSTVKFILLHCGYPYEDDAITLAKYYSNVFIDLTWVHQMDSLTCRQIICKLIEGVPTNKIIAFGGDYTNPINTIGALKIAENNFAYAFNLLCSNDMLTLERAKEILMAWYYDNPKEIYGF